jgi:hypothetical protein
MPAPPLRAVYRTERTSCPAKAIPVLPLRTLDRGWKARPREQDPVVEELSPGRTVNPTPATAGDALEGDRVTRWCEELGDAERDAPAIDLYREARTFNDEAVSQAAKTLVDPTSTSEETDKAYRQIQSTCSELGFELPPS